MATDDGPLLAVYSWSGDIVSPGRLAAQRGYDRTSLTRSLSAKGSVMTIVTPRIADHAIEPLFTDRWSPRAFTGEPIPDEVVAALFEAARWAPSAYNSQPWRFVWAKAGTPEWEPLFDLLVDFNKSWAKTASLIVVILSKSTFSPGPGKPKQESSSHAFDTGAAWANFALQATASGWHAHAAGGFDHEATRRLLNLPADVHPHAIALVGRRGDAAILPEGLRAREQPSDRRPVAEIAFRGHFPG